MKVTVIGIMTSIFVFVLLLGLLQNQVAPPPLPPPQATFAAVSAEATRVAASAAQTATERRLRATTQALQTETSQLHTRSASNPAPPPATPT